MNSMKFYVVCVIVALGFSMVGCQSGGVMDRVRGTVGDSGANSRVQLREAAVNKHEPVALLAAAHNQGQKAVAEADRRELVAWWLTENRGVAIKAIGGQSLSTVVSNYRDLAKNRPEAGTDAEQLWLETMEGYVALFRAQADALDAIASHYETNGVEAALTPEQLSSALALIRERSAAIRGYEVNYASGPVTAHLEPGMARTTVAAAPSGGNSSNFSVSQRDVRDSGRAVQSAQRGDLVGAATRGANVVFPN